LSKTQKPNYDYLLGQLLPAIVAADNSITGATTTLAYLLKSNAADLVLFPAMRRTRPSVVDGVLHVCLMVCYAFV